MYQFSNFVTLCSNHFHNDGSYTPSHHQCTQHWSTYYITQCEHLLNTCLNVCLICSNDPLTPLLQVYISSLVIYSQWTSVAWWLLDKKSTKLLSRTFTLSFPMWWNEMANLCTCVPPSVTKLLLQTATCLLWLSCCDKFCLTKHSESNWGCFYCIRVW